MPMQPGGWRDKAWRQALDQQPLQSPLLAGQDSIYAGPGQVPTYDEPNPTPRTSRAPQFEQFPNLILLQLGVIPPGAQYPPERVQGPVPRMASILAQGPPDALLATLQGQDVIYGDPGQAPTADRPNPTLAARRQQPDLVPNLLPLPPPIRPLLLDLPTTRLRPQAGFEATFQLAGQDIIYGAPGQVPVYDYPNPRSRPPLNVGFASGPNLRLAGQDAIYAGPGQVPAYDWPNPRSPVHIRTGFLVGASPSLLTPPPGEQLLDLPIRAALRDPVGFVAGSFSSLLNPPVALPAGAQSLGLPPKPRPPGPFWEVPVNLVLSAPAPAAPPPGTPMLDLPMLRRMNGGDQGAVRPNLVLSAIFVAPPDLPPGQQLVTIIR